MGEGEADAYRAKCMSTEWRERVRRKGERGGWKERERERENKKKEGRASEQGREIRGK